jgi:hypothetical protein
VIAIPADRREDHRNSRSAEVPAGSNSRWIIADAADGNVASEIHGACDGFLKAQRNASDLGFRNTFALQVLR